MTFGSLFAGIGGFDLGLERAGMTCAWQVENDAYCNKVLEKHWPKVGRWDDVKTFPPSKGNWKVDLICGGFPCVDISNAGKRAGIEGKRSGLWKEFARIIRVLRPQYVLVENVAALLERGIGRVLGDLAASGYNAEWEVLSACAFGASHTRERVFLVAYARSKRCRIFQAPIELQKTIRQIPFPWQSIRTSQHDIWIKEQCAIYGNDYGLPGEVDRFKCLGNAVVPQVAEWIGRRIIEVENGD